MANPNFETAVFSTLVEHGQLLAAIGQAAGAQQEQLSIANQRLEQVIELLTPEEEQRSGPTLAEVMVDLAQRITQQTALLRDMVDLITRMPVEVAKAVSRQMEDGEPQP